MALATLSIDLIAKLADLEAGFAKAARIAENTGTDIQSSFEKLKEGAVELGKTIAEVFAVKELAEFVLSTNEGVAALVKLSQTTGATVENISALEDVAARTGTSFDAMSQSLVIFNRALDKSKAGDEVSRVISAIGLSVKDLKALDPAEAMRQVAVALDGFAESGDKGRAILALFNRSVRDAAPLIHELATQTELHAKVTTEAALRAKELDDQFLAMKKDSLDMAREWLGPVQTAITILIEKYKEAKEAGAAFHEQVKKEEEETAAKANQERADEIARITEKMNDQNTSLKERAKLLDQLYQLQRNQPGSTVEHPAFSDPNFDSPGETRARPKPEIKVADAAQQTAIDKLLQRYREMFEDTLKLTDATKELTKAQAILADPQFAKDDPKKKQAILDFADGLDKQRASAERTKEAMEALRRDDQQYIDELVAMEKPAKETAKAVAALFDNSVENRTQRQIDQEELIRKKFDNSAEGVRKTKEAIDALYGTKADPMLQSFDKIDAALTDLSKTFDHTLGQGLLDLLQGKFSSIGDLFKQMLEQMAADALKANIMDSLFGVTGTSGVRTGGLIKDVLGFALGTGKAGGGPVAPWSLTRVNESGAEGLTIQGKDYLMTGSRGGSVTPAGMIGGAGAVVQVNIAAGVSRNEVAALIPRLTAQIKAEIVTSMRRPGFSGG
jgi:hypothetical protein